MKSLPIVWQRLIDARGQTCPRCGGTLDELGKATAMLEQSLPPLGIRPTLEIEEIDEESFQRDPSQSNRIWIADKPLEDWLGAQTSGSPCCSVCGDTECRTIKLGREEFEVIPAELILEAALLAASQMVRMSDSSKDVETGQHCCSGGK
jgi:hypothetical protein